MKVKSLMIGCLLCSFFSVYAQDFDNYKPVVSSGSLPEDFTRAVSDAAKEAKNKPSDEKDFVLSTAFSLNRIMLSGKVLFNDPMSQFANKVTDELLKNNPELRSKVRVYVIKSPNVNAFATSEGAIFINIGLLAQLENEAQLAFILAHELIHVDKKHSLEQYKKQTEISRGRGVYRDLNRYEKELAEFAYSKEKEQEADELGFLEIFEKSKYSYTAIGGVFDILKYGYLPVDETPFDKSFFENEGFVFPQSYKLPDLKPINVDDEEDDEKSTHPALPIRRETLEKLIKNRSDEGRSKHIIGQSEFVKVRNMARFELCKLQLLDEDYNNAIFNSYIMLKEFPNNKYLLKIIGHTLFWISHNNTSLGKSFYKNVEGESQQLAFLLYKLSSKQKDIDLVSTAFAARLRKQFPDDKEIELLFKECVKHVVKEHDYKTQDLYSVYMNSKTDSVVAEQVNESKQPKENNEGKSKYEKIASSKNTTKSPLIVGHVSDSLNFHKYALAAYMDDSQIAAAFREAHGALPDRDLKKNKRSVKNSAKDFNYGKAAGMVDKVIVVDPYYFGSSVDGEKRIRYLKNEREEKDMVQRIEDCAKAAGVETEVLEPKLFNQNDMARYNDMVLLNEWVYERMVAGTNANDDDYTPVTVLGYEEITKIADNMGTDYAMWTVSLFEKRTRATGRLIAPMILFPPLIPILIHRAINGGSVSHFMAMVYNLKTGELKLSHQNTTWDNNYGYVKNNNIYYVFHQLRQKDRLK